MKTPISQAAWAVLRASLQGELHTDEATRRLYATDASIYRELPAAVALPRHAEDLGQLLAFARQHGLGIIPRAAGTSLAGQCVGPGMVVDVSRHMTQILEVNAAEGWVRVQPGVIRDELNRALRPHGRFFGPNTSTANRAMVGGMVGNNSCGSYSIVYGSTRDHVLKIKALLADGSEAVFEPLSQAALAHKAQLPTLEGEIYRHLAAELGHAATRDAIRAAYPDPRIPRRNTGYAVDLLLPFFEGAEAPAGAHDTLNLCQLLAGSEGTLALFTEITLHCDPLPPPVAGLLCAHFDSLTDALHATVVAMQHAPRAVELMDRTILECTKANAEQRHNRFFVQGDPAAILVIEMGGQGQPEVEARLDAAQAALQAAGLGTAFPRVWGARIAQVWALRAAGLGLLSNIPDAPRPVEIIEDTAVRVEDLPAYIADFAQMMRAFGRQAIYYAHAGAGELHLRPLISLRDPADRPLIRQIAEASARLVKQYRGSLSGEHGDGRVRGEFIPLMLGAEVYALLCRLKDTWDPHGILNPGKIVRTPPMDASLRFDGADAPAFDTVFDFGPGGILAVAEQCNGSGDCRKLPGAGGTMCPSYMATRNERDTTRARANALREYLSRPPAEAAGKALSRFASKDLYDIMDLCLSCKGCASECPSNVDMATLKAEFLHQYHRTHGVPLRAWAVGNIARLNALGMVWPGLANAMLRGRATSALLKGALGMAPQRSLPLLAPQSLRAWFAARGPRPAPAAPAQEVLLFADEFTNFNDVQIGQKAVEVLEALGLRVSIPRHVDSGRAYFSKGLLRPAQRLARRNVALLAGLVSEARPLVGVEPSAILTFRDEYPKLVARPDRPAAEALARHALTLDEFLARRIAQGMPLPGGKGTPWPRILVHGHCHQKAAGGMAATVAVLQAAFPHAEAQVLPTGCCGMAGSFGYEAEHYGLSMQVGELALFPAVRAAGAADVVVAAGTSCRHQIAHGTGRQAFHLAELLWETLCASPQADGAHRGTLPKGQH